MSYGRVLQAGWVVTPDEAGGVEVLKDAWIAVRGSRIEYVGAGADLPAAYAGWNRVDYRNCIVIPGLVNTHNHAAMTLLRGYADDLPLMTWLQEKIWPAEAKLEAADIYWGTMLAAVEQVRAGITTFADMYFFMDEAARAVDEIGMRAQLSRGLIGGPGQDEKLAEAVEFFKRWDGHDDDRITVALAPHAPYTCSDEYVRDILSEARRLEAPIQIHLAETQQEIEQLAEGRGMTPIQWAVEIGLAERPVVAAHCVHLTPGDIKLLAEHGIGVSHNPISNLKLASGIAPVADMLAAGVRVGLGTDGACSTNHLNLFEQMRLAAWLGKVSTMDAAALPAATVFRMATVEGARILGYDDVGRIAEGFRADLAILDADSPHLVPRHDLVSLLVYSAQTTDVKHVMVHGRMIMEDGELLSVDEQAIREECLRRGRNLVERAAAGS